jgi:hypothetical protein
MNAKEMLAALNARFPISAETCGNDFHGAHSITLNAQGQVQLNVWVMTPVGLRSFPTTVSDEYLAVTPEVIVDEMVKSIEAWKKIVKEDQLNSQGKVAISLNGDAVMLDSTELTYEKVAQLAHPDDAPAPQRKLYSVTYCYRGKGGGGTLAPGEKVTAVHGMIVNCCFTGNA